MSRIRIAGILLIVSVIPASAQTVETLLARIPEQANFVAVINNRAILDTPRSVREGWVKKHESEYLAGAIPVPPTVPLAVVGSKFDPADLSNSWSVGVFTMFRPMPIKSIADKHGGSVEQLGGMPVAVTTRYGLIVQLTDEVYGAMFHSSRQDLSRWIRFTRSNRKPAVSEYLQKVLQDSRGQHIALALDTEDLIDPALLHARLLTLKSLAGKPQDDAATVEQLILGMKGLRLTARVGDTTRTTVRLDFSENVGQSIGLLKPCLRELLDVMGGAIDELGSAQWSAFEKTVTIQMDLADTSLARVMALASVPFMDGDSTPSPADVKSELAAASTKRYYVSATTLLRDLEKQNTKAVDYIKTALWHEQFAKKIEQLPTGNVDSEMLQYGTTTASKLRTLALSLRGVPVQVSAADAGYQWWITRAPIGWYRWYDRGWHIRPVWAPVAGSNAADVLSKQAEVIAKDQIEREKVWKSMIDDRSAISRRMLEKHKIVLETK